MRRQLPDYTNSDIARLIDEHIHSAKHRDILMDRLIDGLTLECIAEKRDLSVTAVKRIIYRGEDKLFAKIK